MPCGPFLLGVGVVCNILRILLRDLLTIFGFVANPLSGAPVLESCYRYSYSQSPCVLQISQGIVLYTPNPKGPKIEQKSISLEIYHLA